MGQSHPVKSVSITYIGGPTALIEVGGMRLMTDPTFDPPGAHPVGNRVLTKLVGPALPFEECLPVDAVLLSHDQHPDNLDNLGREALAKVPLTLTTGSAHKRLGGHTQVLANWESTTLSGNGGGTLTITGVPALHGPEGAEAAAGEVTGFVISGASIPTIYISGDNASIDVVRMIRERIGVIDIAILFAGAAQTALLNGNNLTLTSDMAAEAAQILQVSSVVPLHFEHWAHFTQGKKSLLSAFKEKGLDDRLHILEPGKLQRLDSVKLV